MVSAIFLFERSAIREVKQMNPVWRLSFRVVFEPDLKYGTGPLPRVKAFVILEIKP